MHPLRSKTAYTETLGDEVCVYEWTRREVHALNATAASVWQLCDGKTSVAEMADRLRPGLPHAEHVVALALKEFQKKQLLDGNYRQTSPPALFSRRAAVRMGLTALPIVTSIIAPTPLQAQSPGGPTGSQTFNFTGGTEGFPVPAGVTSLTVTAFGAQGNQDFFGLGRPGGLGGMVTATLAVTPGQLLLIKVGGGGQSTNAGGFNGGGLALGPAGGGGGASDVRTEGMIAFRILVAGGGGGGGVRGLFPSGGDGGIGGGTTAGAGQPSGSGGQGGSQVAGGAGGTPLTAGNSGTAGTFGNGGTGATFAVNGTHVAGGGGGGYFGGGGGASDDNSPGGGGGGGSSFAHPSATGVAHVQGVRTGAGLITITW